MARETLHWSSSVSVPREGLTSGAGCARVDGEEAVVGDSNSWAHCGDEM